MSGTSFSGNRASTPLRVGATATEEIVTLTGRVDSYAEKIMAERAVKRVRGVKAVANELRIHRERALP